MLCRLRGRPSECSESKNNNPVIRTFSAPPLAVIKGCRLALVRLGKTSRVRGVNSAVTEFNSRRCNNALAVSPFFFRSNRSTKTIWLSVSRADVSLQLQDSALPLRATRATPTTLIFSPSPNAVIFSRVLPTLKPGTGSGKSLKSWRVFVSASPARSSMFF